MRSIQTAFAFLITCKLSAQFAGPVGAANTTAMHTDSSAFVGWASHCKVQRGPQDISNMPLGNASVGDSSMAIGKAGLNGVVSLGDGGTATLTFSAAIVNGPGFDFAVFENSFSNTFLELAFVEVSSDGINFVRFPATSNSPVSPQYDNNANMDASKLNNLAGKYRYLYGTPFDLQELSGNAQLDLNNITHVRIIDVVGSISPAYARYDMNNTIINDPWATAYSSSGFDLDAIGVINQAAVGIKENDRDINVLLYPNPATDKVTVQSLELGEKNIRITDISGKELLKTQITEQSSELNIGHLQPGIYFLFIANDKGYRTYKIIKE